MKSDTYNKSNSQFSIKNKLPDVSLYILTGLISTVTLFSGTILSPSITYADDSVIDQVNVTVPVLCSLSGSGMNSHTANITNGTYQANIGTTTLKAFCNDSEGFAIYSTGYTGNEIGETNSNKLVGTAASNNATIVTGLATSTPSPDVSNWSMKLTATGDSGDTSGTNALTIDSDTEGSFGVYHTVPNSYTKVAHKTAATSMDSANGGTTLTTTYAAYISKTQVADTYSGQVIYTLVHPSSEEPAQPVACEPGYICYIKGSPNAVGTMANQSTSSNTTVELYPSNFSRTGYGFAGWSDAYDYATNPNANFYGPMEDFTTPSNLTSKGLSLYAVWIKSAGSIQNWTCPNNTTMPIGGVTALTDQRDNQTYAVAKLADGKCWMIENLRLDNQYTTGATNTALAQGYDSSFTGLAESESSLSESTTANSLYSIDGSTENTISGYWQDSRFPRYNNQNTASRGTNTTTGQNIYSYGNYYTWAAAIADTTHYSVANTTVANTSICPAGWRLPIGGTSADSVNPEFWQLGIAVMGFTPSNDSSYNNEVNTDNKTASQMFKSYPNNMVRSGFKSGSAPNYQYGGYWSSTVYRNPSAQAGAYSLQLTSNTLSPGSSYANKYAGATIRCIASGS